MRQVAPVGFGGLGGSIGLMYPESRIESVARARVPACVAHDGPMDLPETGVTNA
jgi:hypothetical protein